MLTNFKFASKAKPINNRETNTQYTSEIANAYITSIRRLKSSFFFKKEDNAKRTDFNRQVKRWTDRQNSYYYSDTTTRDE